MSGELHEMIRVIGLCSPLHKWELVVLVCTQHGKGPDDVLISRAVRFIHWQTEAQQEKMTCPGSHSAQSYT